MFRLPKIGLCAAALAVAAFAPAAWSQVSPFGPGSFNLTRSDLTLLGAAEAKLYGATAKVGAIENWNNPATGDNGTVTLVSRFERDGMPCRRLVHEIKVHGIKGTRQFLITRCQDPGGSWKILP